MKVVKSGFRDMLMTSETTFALVTETGVWRLALKWIKNEIVSVHVKLHDKQLC